jgi:hypothetical protein
MGTWWNTLPPRPFADPEKAARRILEIANAVEPIQGRIHIEKINEPFLFRDRGSPAEYGAGLKLAIERGWLKTHESGTFVTFTPAWAVCLITNSANKQPPPTKKPSRRS